MTLEELRMIFEPMKPGSFSHKRYEICKSCDEFRGASKTCSLCNCLMPAKVRIPSMTCPAGKWQEEKP
jgi:hypothetical protein